MKSACRSATAKLFLIAMVLSLAGLARADEKVTLSDMHVCCKGCVMAIQNAAAKVPGVKCVASEDDSDAVLTADNAETLQKATDEIVKSGFYGTSDNPKVKIEPAKVPTGNVQHLEISHVHNCCGKCTVALKGALKDVPGVTSNTVESKKTSFTVEGNFSPAAVVDALQKAGFYPEIKEAK